MKLLAIDSATEACSMALSVDGRVLERFHAGGKEHSGQLPQMLAALLAEAGLVLAQLDGLVAGIGPGGFAGVRVGVSFAQGLALARDLPVVGVSSLAMLAQQALRRGAEGPVLAAIDARMGEVYYGYYTGATGDSSAAAGTRPQAELIDAEAVAAPAAVPLSAGRVAAIGTGWRAADAALLRRWHEQAPQAVPTWQDAEALPHACDGLQWAQPLFATAQAVSAEQLLPRYLRNRVAATLAEQRQARAAQAGDGAVGAAVTPR